MERRRRNPRRQEQRPWDERLWSLRRPRDDREGRRKRKRKRGSSSRRGFGGGGQLLLASPSPVVGAANEATAAAARPCVLRCHPQRQDGRGEGDGEVGPLQIKRSEHKHKHSPSEVRVRSAKQSDETLRQRGVALEEGGVGCVFAERSLSSTPRPQGPRLESPGEFLCAEEKTRLQRKSLEFSKWRLSSPAGCPDRTATSGEESAQTRDVYFRPFSPANSAQIFQARKTVCPRRRRRAFISSRRSLPQPRRRLCASRKKAES